MNLLLDTHVFLRFCQGDPSLSATAKALLEDAGNRKLLSLASVWEIAIKAGFGRLKLGEPSATYVPAALVQTGFELLSLSVEHATFVESLPLHHRDPFDRLLVAQAMVEAVPVVSVDTAFDFCGVRRLWRLA